MTITTGISFPPGGPQAGHAARAWSLAADASGGIAVATLGSGLSSGSLGGVLAYSPATSAWYQEIIPTLTQYFVADASGDFIADPSGVLIVSPGGSGGAASPQWPAAVVNGYLLDYLYGLYGWAGGIQSFTSPPQVSLASGASGIFAIGPTGAWNSGGVAVSGLTTSGVFAGLASGGSLWLLAGGTVWQATLANSASASSVVSAALPFTATCMAASGSALAVGGYIPFSLGSGAYALAVEPGGTALVAFPGGGKSQAWVLSGQPASWQALAATSGLPAYSTGIVADWAPNGNQILLSDYGSGHWMAFSYTAGTLALLSSGSLAGIGPGLAISSDSQYALIPNSGGSGFNLLVASGIGWAASGYAGGSGPASLAAAVSLVSGDTFAVGFSGQAALLGANAGVWQYSASIPLGFTPSIGLYDPTSSLAYWVSTSNAASTTWAGSITGVVASGGLGRLASGVPSSIIVSRGQVVLAQPSSAAGQLIVLGPTSPGVLSVQNIEAAPGVTLIADPLADFSLAEASSASLSFWSFNAPFSLAQSTSGVYARVAGGVVSPASGLGPGYVPSALGSGAAGNFLLATYSGGLGPIASGGTGQTQMLASGGFGAILAASGVSWMPTEVQGGLAWASGL